VPRRCALTTQLYLSLQRRDASGECNGWMHRREALSFRRRVRPIPPMHLARREFGGSSRMRRYDPGQAVQFKSISDEKTVFPSVADRGPDVATVGNVMRIIREGSLRDRVKGAVRRCLALVRGVCTRKTAGGGISWRREVGRWTVRRRPARFSPFFQQTCVRHTSNRKDDS